MPKFERILLIDDNESDNVFHEIMLRRAGFVQEVIVFEAALRWRISRRVRRPCRP